MKTSSVLLVFFLLFVSLLVAPLFGAKFISPLLYFDASDKVEHQILMQLRVPRCMMAFAAGAGLAICGAIYQALFRNPLATPFTLGVSSGAAFGAAVVTLSGLSLSLWGLDLRMLAAFCGALLTVVLITMLARLVLRDRLGSASTELLLAGVVASLFFSSLILLLQYISDFTQIAQLSRWLMGNIAAVSPGTATVFLTTILVLCGLSLRFSSELDLIQIDEDFAMARGVEIFRVRRYIVLLTSAIVGLIVAFCGPIGFVGIMVPHMVRRWVGPHTSLIMFFSVIVGGAFLVFSDILGRSLIPNYEIPVGVITAVQGAPFFVLAVVLGRVRSRGVG